MIVIAQRINETESGDTENSLFTVNRLWHQLFVDLDKKKYKSLCSIPFFGFLFLYFFKKIPKNNHKVNPLN